MKKFFAIILVSCFLFFVSSAQDIPDKIYVPNIHTVMLYQAGNFYGYPIINLGAVGATELDFDDFDNRVKNYSYTFVLCNADWQPVDLSPFDFIKGYSQNNITRYNVSSIAKTKYIHYTVMLPESNCLPSKSGNYLVKVFLNGNPDNVVFTKRLLIVNNTIPAGIKILQPFNQDLFKTSQKVQFTIDVSRLNIQDPLQQIKVVVLQNYRWDNALSGMQPQFMRGSSYEYNGEQDCIFPAGKEFRFLDMRNFLFDGLRIKNIDENVIPFNVTVMPDIERTQVRFLTYADRDGFYEVSTTDNSNALYQGDYANVHFTFVPDSRTAYPNKNIYIVGQMTNYALDNSTQMQFNADSGFYEKTLLLKQGYYTYTYTARDADNPAALPDAALTDGNYWETENNYTVLVYYRSFSDRADQLVCSTTVNSLTSRSSFQQ
jgi:hypothetical protein